MSFFARANRWIGHLERAAIAIAALCVFAIMLIIFADVAARYFFRSPFSWSYDLISLYLVVAAFFLALSDTLQKNHHINVDILFRRVSVRAGHWLYALGYAFAGVSLAGIAYGGLIRMIESIEGREVSSGVIEWPTWVGFACVAFGVALLWLRVVYRALAHATAAATGNDGIAGIRSPRFVAVEI